MVPALDRPCSGGLRNPARSFDHEAVVGGRKNRCQGLAVALYQLRQPAWGVDLVWASFGVVCWGAVVPDWASD